MSKTHRAAWLVAMAMMLQACGDASLAEPAPAQQSVAALETPAEPEDILARLQSIPGLTVVIEQPSPFPGTRFFLLKFEQPADHARPHGERFQLRMTLLHRSVAAPMVLSTEGYMLSASPWQSEPTELLGANQLSVEHRFMGTSVPASRDTRLLNIYQAASDSHRVIQAFKPLYRARWLSTGGSKGGMAAVYHRYFYPDDVDVTLPYVAPSNHGLRDVRYVHFLAKVGDADCRAKLESFQQDVLRRREEMLPFVDALGTKWGTGFTVVGGPDRALEFSAVEVSFYFWQYGTASACASIPAPGAPAAETFAFLDGVVGVAFTYADRFIAPFEYAYYQAATQLGWSRFPANHLRGLLRYPGENTPDVYVSFPVTEPFDMRGMLQVEHWVRNHGKRMLFIYGENDPYSAAAFSVREGNDAFRFFAPQGNHGASIGGLSEPERALALERLFTWMGMSVPSAEVQARQVSPRMIGRAADRTLLTCPVSTPRAQPWDAQTKEPHDEPFHPCDF
ncbi:S28 family serine protease [Myxococcus stipitatus]|uniref:S28 family serine protease n=1 Tax=Myxococcus stipitatus TaxID=83455 RepID=UPI0030CFAAFF